MSGHEVIEVGMHLLTSAYLDGGNTGEEGLDEVDRHQEKGLIDDNTSASEQERWWPEDFKKRECNTFIEDSSRDRWCQCGHPRDKHLTDIKTAEDTEWTTELHSSEHPTDAYGYLKFEGEIESSRFFLRLSSNTEPSPVYDLLTREYRLPTLVVSVVGGEGSAEVKPWVQEVIREGLVNALHKIVTDTEMERSRPWILTEGFDEGIGRCVGEASRGRYRVARVGITPWGVLHKKDQLVDPQDNIEVQYSAENKTNDSCCLEKNHDVFLLVDDGSEGRRGGEENFRAKLLEEHIPTQHIRESSSITIPVLCILISGELFMLERVVLSVTKSTPWLVLAGSGGVADLLSDILENQSPASAGDDVVRVTELVKKHFPSEAQTGQLVEQVQSIYQNRNLITFYHEEKERPEDFDTVMIKALMPASKQRASGDTFPYCKELILAMRWNRVDFASRQLFNDDININWKDEALKDCMTFALINGKTQFVRLFIEKKFDFEEYLTYGFLETLYSTVGEGTLLYKLLLERLKERLGTSDSLEEISLFEVSLVLKKLMGEEKLFYFTVLGLEDFTSAKKALEHVRKLMEEGEDLMDGEYRNQSCKSPWTDLLIWAVLQNHSDMAVFFWEMTEEPVLNALSACKMLREMSKMEYETETKRSMKDLSLKFENLAQSVMGPCYQNDENNSFKLLNKVSPVWGTNCFEMAMAAESLLFFNHDGLESMLSQIWWGDMKRDTPVWKFLLTFFCPLLLCTNLITFKDSDTGYSRWRQFWSASITTFVSNAVMYILFLFLFAYVLLVDFKPPPPSGPSICEYLLYFWVFTFLCEEIRQAFSVRLYGQDLWNWCDVAAIILFIIGLICRMFKWSYEAGRGVLCIDYMVFTLRLIHISTIHKEMGPKIIIVGKMMKDVISFLFFLGVWILAYGVATQALLYPFDPFPDRIFRRVFYRPYLYIFGDLNLEEIDVYGKEWEQNCTKNMTLIDDVTEPCRSEYNNWLVMVLLVVFLLVTNILLINLLIAILSNTFNKVEEKSDLYWRFQHYQLVMEYQSRPSLAPPFIIINHLYLFSSFLKKICKDQCCKENNHSQASPRNDPNILHDRICDGCQIDIVGTRYVCTVCADYDLCSACQSTGFHKEHLLRTIQSPLQEWEREQKQKFLEAQSETERSSDSERIKQISDKVDRMEKQQQNQLKQLTEQLNETKASLTEQFTAQRTEMRALETKVENALSQILETLAKAPWTKPPHT